MVVAVIRDSKLHEIRRRRIRRQKRGRAILHRKCASLLRNVQPRLSLVRAVDRGIRLANTVLPAPALHQHRPRVTGGVPARTATKNRMVATAVAAGSKSSIYHNVLSSEWRKGRFCFEIDRIYRARTNIFPGICLMSRFISRLSNATDAAELGRPLLRITSSMLISSSARNVS